MLLCPLSSNNGNTFALSITVPCRTRYATSNRCCLDTGAPVYADPDSYCRPVQSSQGRNRGGDRPRRSNLDHSVRTYENRKQHRVPLVRHRLSDIGLEQGKPIHNDLDFVFPSTTHPNHVMTSAAFVRNSREIGLSDMTLVHGFRTSFRTWAHEWTDIPCETSEMALAHTVGDAVERVFL